MTEKDNPYVTHPNREGEEAYHQGWQNYAEGNFAQAVQQFKQALSGTPGEPDYLYALGLTHEAAGQSQEALEAFSQTLAQLNPMKEAVRARMIQRMAKAHMNKIQTGDWGAFTNPEHR